MTQRNTFASLLQTGLGSPLLMSPETVNVWQQVEGFERLPVFEGVPVTPDVNPSWAFLQTGIDASYLPQGGILLTRSGPLPPDNFFLAPRTTTGLASADLAGVRGLFFDVHARLVDFQDLDAFSIGFTDLTSGASLAAIGYDPPGSEFIGGILDNGVPDIRETGVLVDNAPHRFTVVLDAPFAGNRNTAYVFIDGKLVVRTPGLPPVVGLQPYISVGPLSLGPAMEIYGLRTGFKYRA
jgi:hypothetical protein